MLTQQNEIMQAVVAQNVVTMSSREIAELVGSRHDKVKQSIERLATVVFHDDGTVKKQAVIRLPPVGEYLDSLGRPATEYRVCKRDSYIIVAQLSPEFTARLVDRWQELESRNAVTLPDFTNPAEAARAWADQVEANQVAMIQIEQAKPAVQFVDKYVDSTGLKAFREVCKILQANESRFREFLADSKIMYRLNGTWVPYQNHIDAGRLSVKTGVANHNGHAFTDVKFTPKGLNWVAGEWAKHQIQGEVA